MSAFCIVDAARTRQTGLAVMVSRRSHWTMDVDEAARMGLSEANTLCARLTADTRVVGADALHAAAVRMVPVGTHAVADLGHLLADADAVIIDVDARVAA